MVRTGYFTFVVAVGLATIIGSASTPAPNHNARVQEFYRTIPTCSGDRECERMWSAAQVWVAKNAGMKIQVATDSIIETYNSTSWSRLAVRVIKEPTGDDGYKFVVKTWCEDNTCVGVDSWAAALDFNRTVAAVGKGV